jgi:hypothetical protein
LQKLSGLLHQGKVGWSLGTEDASGIATLDLVLAFVNGFLHGVFFVLDLLLRYDELDLQ